MRREFIYLMMAVVVLTVVLTSCEKDKEETTFTVTFNANGGSEVTSQNIINGEKAVEPKDPAKVGYVFDGWFSDNNTFVYKWNFATNAVTENITLYAKWEADNGNSNSGNNGNGNSGGNGTITMTTSIFGLMDIRMAGSGTVTIDWGDGSAIETHTLFDGSPPEYKDYNNFDLFWEAYKQYLEKFMYRHNYYSGTTRTITITGKNITEFECIKMYDDRDPTNQLITSLDISEATALIKLECSFNLLTNLDVSNNTKLTRLGVGKNPLKSLDVSNNTALKFLDCYNNKLVGLNLSNNTVLTELWCDKNQLSSSALDALFDSLHNNDVGEQKKYMDRW